MMSKRKRGRACWFNVYLENGKQVVSRYSFGTRISAHNTGRHYKTLYRIRVRFYLEPIK